MTVLKLGYGDLSCISLHYECPDCMDGADVDVFFSELSGVPLCDDCDREMEIVSAEVVLSAGVEPTKEY